MDERSCWVYADQVPASTKVFGNARVVDYKKGIWGTSQVSCTKIVVEPTLVIGLARLSDSSEDSQGGSSD